MDIKLNNPTSYGQLNNKKFGFSSSTQCNTAEPGYSRRCIPCLQREFVPNSDVQKPARHFWPRTHLPALLCRASCLLKTEQQVTSTQLLVKAEQVKAFEKPFACSWISLAAASLGLTRANAHGKHAQAYSDYMNMLNGFCNYCQIQLGLWQCST